jgi:hypothetical protein
MTGEFVSPFSQTLLKEAERREYSADDISLLSKGFTVFDQELDGNFTTYESTRHPGVRFSVAKVTVDENFARQIQGLPLVSPEEQQIGKRTIVLQFSPFGVAPADHARMPQDGITDAAFRSLGKVTRAMENGQPVPQTDIYSLGTTMGLGGKDTGLSMAAKAIRGFTVQGEDYAEFLEAKLREISPELRLEELVNVKVIFQGASRGGIMADQTADLIVSQLQQKGIDLNYQVRLDNPVGRGNRVAYGIARELLYQSKQPFMQDLQKAEANFEGGYLAHLAQELGLSEEEVKVTAKQLLGTLIDGVNLYIGAPLHLDDTRQVIVKNNEGTDIEKTIRTHYMVSGVNDLLRDKDWSTELFSTIQNALMISYKANGGRHIFSPYLSLHRWAAQIRRCQEVGKKIS